MRKSLKGQRKYSQILLRNNRDGNNSPRQGQRGKEVRRSPEHLAPDCRPRGSLGLESLPHVLPPMDLYTLLLTLNVSLELLRGLPGSSPFTKLNGARTPHSRISCNLHGTAKQNQQENRRVSLASEAHHSVREDQCYFIGLPHSWLSQ